MDRADVETLAERVGLLTTEGARRAGLSARTVRDRCRPGGPYSRVAPGVVLLGGGAPAAGHRLVAALVRGPRSAAVTGAAACALRGVAVPGPAAVLLPHASRGVRVKGVRVVRTRKAFRVDAVPVAGACWPVVDPVRAAADAVRLAPAEAAARDVVQRLLRCGLVEPQLLADALAQRAVGTSLLEVVDRLRLGGTWSPPEDDVVRLSRSSRVLPEPLLNCAVVDLRSGRVVARPDGIFWALALAWQVDSRRWHEGEDEWGRTLDVGLVCEEAGLRVLHLAPEVVDRRPGAVVATFERLAVERLDQGPPQGLRLAPEIPALPRRDLPVLHPLGLGGEWNGTEAAARAPGRPGRVR